MKANQLFGLGSAALVAGLMVAGCAARDTEDETAANDAAVDVNVCKKGTEVPQAETSWYLSKNYATYNQAHGVRVAIAGVDNWGLENFNPIEYGYQAGLVSQDHQGSIPLDGNFVEACKGTLRIVENAKVNLPSTDAASVAWYCAPNTLSGSTCSVKEGAELILTVHNLIQLNGFVVTTDALNLRRTPTTENIILETIPAATTITLTGKYSNKFYEVTHGDKRGWVHSDYVRPFTGTAKTTDALNLREQPSTQAAIDVLIPKGATVTVYGNGAGQFMYVGYGDHYGYASGAYLTSPVYDPSMGGEGGK
jgi:uncharacterized protein YraI